MKTPLTIALAIALALACLPLSGCVSPLQPKQPTTISIWHVYGAQTDSPLNDLVETFNNTVGVEEGIRVEVTMVSNNKNIHEDILAAANDEPGAAALPDIFVAYPKTVLALPDPSVLVDYRDYFSEEELSSFVPSFLEDGTVDGRLTCLPVAKSTEMLFVNKTDFDRFSKATGITIDSLETWEGLFAACCAYEKWTDSLTPDVKNDGKAFLVHDFHFNYFQVGAASLGSSFFDGQNISFNTTTEDMWRPYAQAAIVGGIWLQDGYATEPLRTGEAIASVASSASVLYFTNEVIHSDNTTENVEFEILPCPTFTNGKKMVMQRGAGMCTVKSTPEKEQAAIRFLKWLTEAERNTQFAVNTGYMPVKTEAYDTYLPAAVDGLTDQKYIELYEAYGQTQKSYEFYSAPQSEDYLKVETGFETNIRKHLAAARKTYLEANEGDETTLDKLTTESYEQFKNGY